MIRNYLQCRLLSSSAVMTVFVVDTTKPNMWVANGFYHTGWTVIHSSTCTIQEHLSVIENITLEYNVTKTKCFQSNGGLWVPWW